jgi:hypothetical protein
MPSASTLSVRSVVAALVGIFLSAFIGTIAGAIVDGNGLDGDDAYLIGLWIGFAGIYFGVVAAVSKTALPYLAAVVVWWVFFACWDLLVTGEGDGYPIAMGHLGLIAAFVAPIPRLFIVRNQGR